MTLADITPEKLHEAASRMMSDLGISGSTGNYDVYAALQKERRKAVQARRALAEGVPCDNCGCDMSKAAYRRSQGLCLRCLEAIN